MITLLQSMIQRFYILNLMSQNFLNTGENVIGVVLGNGCYCVDYPRWDMYVPSWQHHPKLILTLSVKFADGGIICVESDTSWKVSESCIIYNQTKRGETHDARLEKLGWNDVGFNDSDWGNAFICRSPGGVLKNRLPPIRNSRRFSGCEDI